MIRFVKAALLAFMAALPLAAQPFINYRGIVNAASFEGPGLPGGSIAQGSIFTIFGSNLGPAQAMKSSSYPLQNQLGGVSVQITQGSTTLAAIPIVAYASQVSAIMPSTAPLGQVLIRVQYNNQTSNVGVANVVAASPGLFSVASSGFGPGVIQNYVSSTNQPVNTTQVTAQPGQVLTLWATGLGPVPYADNIAPTAGNVPAQISVFVGGQPATVAYSGRSPCCSGLDQIVFTVPANAPTGCYVPVQVQENGKIVSNAVTVAIDKAGAACTDSFNPIGTALRNGGSNGIVLPQRYTGVDNISVDSLGTAANDVLIADLQQDPGGATYFNPAFSLPPPGTCTMYSAAAATAPANIALFAPNSKALDGGSALKISSGGLSGSAGRVAGFSQLYGALIGQNPSIASTAQLLYSFPGPFTLTIPGGANVQAATDQGSTTAPVTWTNQSSITTVTRSSGLTVTWTGGNSSTDVVAIGVMSNNNPANSSAMIGCLAPVTAGTFTVPPALLAALPATPANSAVASAYVGVSSFPLLNPSQFSATGLNAGFLLPASATVQAVVVQ